MKTLQLSRRVESRFERYSEMPIWECAFRAARIFEDTLVETAEECPPSPANVAGLDTRGPLSCRPF